MIRRYPGVHNSIEREDIMAVADSIDTVTDTIEDVLMRMYMFNIKKVTEHALKMTDIIVNAAVH